MVAERGSDPHSEEADGGEWCLQLRILNFTCSQTWIQLGDTTDW